LDRFEEPHAKIARDAKSAKKSTLGVLGALSDLCVRFFFLSLPNLRITPF
jgi:hypothetical protein